MAGGTANLIFRAANGYSNRFGDGSLPAAPVFTIASSSPAPADNSGASTNIIYWQATEDIELDRL